MMNPQGKRICLYRNHQHKNDPGKLSNNKVPVNCTVYK